MKRETKKEIPCAKDHSFAVITATFHEDITKKLHFATINCLKSANANSVIEYFVPGAFELPLASQWVGQTDAVDAIIALGCIIQGETPHFDYVCSESAKGLCQVSLRLNKPVIFGVLTTHNVEQALARCGENTENKGLEAAITAIEMVLLQKKIKKLA